MARKLPIDPAKSVWHFGRHLVELNMVPFRQTSMDEEEREAIRAEGLDPDDPAVLTRLDFVSWELELLGRKWVGEWNP